MIKCWAECLGDCSDEQSGEHIVSRGLFSDVVSVQGFSWCKEPRQIGINKLTKNILCTHHNNTLSPVDQAAIDAFNVFREATRLGNVRQTLEERRWSVAQFQIDGAGLERWFLKTLINVAAGGKEKIGPRSTEPGKPSCDLVEIAFARRRFVNGGGLHGAGEVGETINSEDRVTFTPLFDPTSEFVLAGAFFFRAFRFMLALDEAGFPERLNFSHKDGRHTSHPKPLRHLKQIRATVGPSQYLSHRIKFNWE